MKLKKLLAVLLTVVLLFAVLPIGTFTVRAAKSGTTGDCTWTLDGTVLTINGNGAMDDYSYGSALPWGTSITKVTIENGVTRVGERSFYMCSSLVSVTIPGSVASIREQAFYGCDVLENVYITDIEAWCNILFENIYSNPMIHTDNLYLNEELLTSLTIPDGITNIGYMAFYNCRNITSIIIPDSVTSIGDYAFENCCSLTSITIPNGVTSIGMDAFDHCNSLTDINIPSSVKTIGAYSKYDVSNGTFHGCSSLENVYITDITAWCNISFSNDASNPMYYADNLYLNDKLLTSLTVPDNLTSVGDFTFIGCSTFTAITIPNSITSIGDSAFENCSALTSITISENVKSIGNSTFRNCGSLASITLPNSVTSIGCNAFSGCDLLASITIPTSVITIDYGAFHNCTSLVEVNYYGTEEQWNNITIGGCNEPLLNAERVYIVFNDLDLNCDGNINAGDITILRKELFSSSGNLKFDINGSGTVDVRDLINLKKQVAGIN